MKTKSGDTEQMTRGTPASACADRCADRDGHADLKAGLIYYLAGCFPALPHEVAKRIAAEMVEEMLRAVREAEKEKASNE